VHSMLTARAADALSNQLVSGPSAKSCRLLHHTKTQSQHATEMGGSGCGVMYPIFHAEMYDAAILMSYE
jgi:hypothetical protein